MGLCRIGFDFEVAELRKASSTTNIMFSRWRQRTKHVLRVLPALNITKRNLDQFFDCPNKGIGIWVLYLDISKEMRCSIPWHSWIDGERNKPSLRSIKKTWRLIMGEWFWPCTTGLKETRCRLKAWSYPYNNLAGQGRPIGLERFNFYPWKVGCTGQLIKTAPFARFLIIYWIQTRCYHRSRRAIAFKSGNKNCWRAERRITPKAIWSWVNFCINP